MPKRTDDASIPRLERRKGSSTFYAFWYDPDTRRTERQSMGTSDPRTAQARFTQWLIERQRLAGEDPAGTAAKLTLADVFDDYLLEHAQVKATHPDWARYITNNLRQHFGGMTVEEFARGIGPDGRPVTYTAVEAYVRRRAAGEIGCRPTRSDATLRSELSILRAALNHGVKMRRLSVADVPHFDLPAAPDPRPDFYTKEETARLLEAAKGVTTGTLGEGRMTRAYRFCHLAYWTAARKRSLVELKWFQVDLRNDLIHLNPPGRKQTSKRRPTVAIVPPLKAVLARAKQEKMTEYVLDSGVHVKHAFDRALVAAGIDRGSPHTMRHTRATHMLQDGVDIWDVAKLLGNTVREVERTYGHHDPKYLRDKIQHVSLEPSFDDQAGGGDAARQPR